MCVVMSYFYFLYFIVLFQLSSISKSILIIRQQKYINCENFKCLTITFSEILTAWREMDGRTDSEVLEIGLRFYPLGTEP